MLLTLLSISKGKFTKVLAESTFNETETIRTIDPKEILIRNLDSSEQYIGSIDSLNASNSVKKSNVSDKRSSSLKVSNISSNYETTKIMIESHNSGSRQSLIVPNTIDTFDRD